MPNRHKKQIILLASVAVLSSVSLGAVVLSRTNIGHLFAKTESYSLTLDGGTVLTERDHGFYHAATVKDNEFDFLGYSPVEGKLGNIKKKNYNGVYDYNGIVYNRSLINGFNSLTVTYSGATLYYELTSFLMENMRFDKSKAVVSGTPIEAGAGDAYFILYTDDAEQGSDIQNIVLDYDCDGNIDDTMIFNKNSTLINARSASKTTELTDNYMVLENNPTAATNNYSVGKASGQSNSSTWYRWNGMAWKDSASLGVNFEINITILGNISQAVNYYENPEDNYFNYSVWPELYYGDATKANWAEIYIGNDNYEPLGKDDESRPHKDLYGDYSFSGRFITNYVYYEDIEAENPNDKWQFADPDTFKVVDDSMTFREAYEAFTLPYWHVKYAFTTTPEDGTYCDTYVNGIQFFHEEFLEQKHYVEGKEYYIHTLHNHCVNYGKADGSPAASYEGVFTYPRLG